MSKSHRNSVHQSNNMLNKAWNHNVTDAEESESYKALWQALYDNSYAALEAALTKDCSAINSKGTGYLQGETPLIFSANTGRTSFARLLLRFGAELSHRNLQGKTALQIAEEKQNEDIITELTEYQKKIDLLPSSAKMFHLKILEGIKLKESGKCDPYVRIAWDDSKKKIKTPHVAKSVDPKWDNCVYELPIPDPKPKILQLSVHHSESIGNTFLGCCSLPFEAIIGLYPGPNEFSLKLGPKVNSKKKKEMKTEKITGSLKFEIVVTLKQKLKPQLHFGRALSDSLKTSRDENNDHLIDVCIKNLFSKEALTSEGIIRIPGSKPEIYKLKDQFDDGLKVNIDNEDPFVVAGLLKLYFYSLPDSLFPQTNYLECKDIDFESEDNHNSLTALKAIIDKVPEPNITILRKVITYFATLSSFSSENKMDARAISISIGPSLVVSPDIREDPVSFVSATKVAPSIMQWMMKHAQFLGLLLNNEPDST